MSLIKRILLVVVAVGAFAQPAYSMDYIPLVVKFMKPLQPYAVKFAWYGGYQLIGNLPVITVTTFIVYTALSRRFAGEFGKLGKKVDIVGQKVDGVEKKVDEANHKLSNIEQKQGEHGTILNSVQNNVAAANVNIGNVITNQQSHSEKLEFLTKGHGENQEALLDILHGQEDMENGLKVLEKKIDDISFTLSNDRAKKEDQEKAFDTLIKEQEKLYKAVGELQANGKLQSDDIVLRIAALDEKIDKTQDSYMTRVDRLEDEFKKYKKESSEQINKLHEEYALLRKELKERDEAAKKEKEEIEIRYKQEIENLQNTLLAAIKDGNSNLRESIKIDTQTTVAITVAKLNNKDTKGLPSTTDNGQKPLNIFPTFNVGVRNTNKQTSVIIDEIDTLNQPVYVSPQTNFVTTNSLPYY